MSSADFCVRDTVLKNNRIVVECAVSLARYYYVPLVLIVLLSLWGIDDRYLLPIAGMIVILWACMGAYIAQLRCIGCKAYLYRDDWVRLSDFKKLGSLQSPRVLYCCPKCGAQQYS